MKFLLHTCCAPCSVACLASLRAEHITPTLFWYNPNIHPLDEYERRRDTLFTYAETLGLALIKDDCYQQDEFIKMLVQGLGGEVSPSLRIFSHGKSCEKDSPLPPLGTRTLVGGNAVLHDSSNTGSPVRLRLPGAPSLRIFSHGIPCEKDSPLPPLPFPGRCQFCYRARMERTALAAKENGFDSFSTTLFISPYQNHELLKQEAEAAAKKYGVELLYRDFRPQFRQGQNEARALGMYMQKYCGCILSKDERS